MKAVPIHEAWFEGAVSVQHGDGWLQPWRLPCDRLDLYPAPGNSLVDRAAESSGVRLRFETSSSAIGLRFAPLSSEPVPAAHALDLTIEGDLVASHPVPRHGDSALFSGLPKGRKTVEIWLPHDCGIRIASLEVEDRASCRTVSDPRPRWVTYGSSLTHCRRAHSPARTWPAIAARRRQLNLTALGYGGNCCLEPMVGLMIRDLPADLITLKLGINCVSGALSPRTFAAAVVGLVQIIREKHPVTPLALISPIAYPPHESQPSVAGNTTQRMRADIEDVCQRLVRRGDGHLYRFDGLDLFSEAEIAKYSTDQCHPNADGIEVMAEHFVDRILDRIPLRRPNVG